MFNANLCLNRIELLADFFEKGFCSLQGFFNVCKDFSEELTDFQIIEFYKGTRYDVDVCIEVQSVLSALSYS